MTSASILEGVLMNVSLTIKGSFKKEKFCSMPYWDLYVLSSFLASMSLLGMFDINTKQPALERYYFIVICIGFEMKI